MKVNKFLLNPIWEIELTKYCQYGCKYCINTFFSPLKKGFMHLEVLDRFFYIFSPYIRYLDIAGVGDLESIPGYLLDQYFDIFFKYKTYLTNKILLNVKLWKHKYSFNDDLIVFLKNLYDSKLIKSLSFGLFDYYFLTDKEFLSSGLKNFISNVNLLHSFLGFNRLNIEIVVVKTKNINKLNFYKNYFQKVFPGIEVFYHMSHNWAGVKSNIEGNYKMDFRYDAGNLYFFPFLDISGNIRICSIQSFYDDNIISSIYSINKIEDLFLGFNYYKINKFLTHCKKCNIKKYCFTYKYFIKYEKKSNYKLLFDL